jgi:hypothetical protein
MKIKIFIAHPTSRNVNPYTHNSLMYNLWELGKAGIDIDEPRAYDEYPLSRARNIGMKEFLESDCTHIFWYDDDQIFTKGVLLRLLRADKPIVSGWYLTRKGNLGLVIFSRGKDKKLLNERDFNYYRPMSIKELYVRQDPSTPSLSIVDGIGMGVVLMTREAVEKIRDSLEPTGKPMFLEWSPILSPDVHEFGEDLWFSDVCAYAEIPLYVHRGCFVGHWAAQGFIIGATHLQARMMQEGITDFKLSDLIS